MPQENTNSSERPSNYQVLIPQEYYANNTGDEISLKEIWGIFVKGKYIILGFLVSFFVVAIFYISTATPVYQVNTKLRLGWVQLIRIANPNTNTVYIENMDDIVLQYDHKNGVSVTYDDENSRGRGLVYLNLTKSGVNPEDVFDSVNTVVNEILTKHDKYYEEVKAQKINSINLIKTQLESIKLQLQEIKKLKERAKGDSKIMILTEERSLQTREVELHKELTEQKLALRDLIPTVVLDKPVMPTNPVKPKKRIIVVVSIILGLVAGIFAVFVMNFVAKIREAQN